MKILITWLGFHEDYKKTGASFQFDPSRFTGTLQKEIVEAYGFDKHLIICTEDRDGSISKEIKAKKYSFTEYMNDFFPDRKYELLESGIDKSDLQDFTVIQSSLRSILQSIDASDELHVVAGTGPTAVGMAWCTLQLSMKNRFQLHVLQRPEYAPGGKVSSLKRIEPFVSQLLDDTLREHHVNLNLPDDIYVDEIVKQEYNKALVYAQANDINILILGETGCGKDKIAEFIVKNSSLSKENYRAINCASLPDEVLYSELFGHVKGAFTGASENRKGLFEECNGGTLFLDEVGDISSYMQQSLLRAIENKEIKRLGTNEVLKNIRVRIIAATNNNLYEKCKEGKFRWDLYYRLSNPEIVLKPYRTRTLDERKAIMKHYFKILEKKWNRKIKLSREAEHILETYSFPGNFREIFNTLNSLYPLQIEIIKAEDLPERFRYAETQMDERYETVLKKHCISIYEKYNYDLAKTKQALGYGNSTQLKNKLIDWGVYRAL